MRPKRNHMTLAIEHACVRDPRNGFEPEGSYGSVRYLEHGFPSELVRWHYHEEYVKQGAEWKMKRIHLTRLHISEKFL